MPGFHAKTFELLEMVPKVSPIAVEELSLFERRMGKPLPESFREWYSIDGACEILERNSNCDWPLKVMDWGMPQIDTSGGPNGRHPRDLLIFQYENQAVCAWAVDLDCPIDPPVVVRIDSVSDLWRPCSPSFSHHVYSRVWDYTFVFGKPVALQAQNIVLGENALSSLQKQFSHGPVTFGWPGHTQYRFFKENQHLLIWASDDQADWWLAADDEETLETLALSIWNYDGVGQSLWANTDEGEEILKRLRHVV